MNHRIVYTAVFLLVIFTQGSLPYACAESSAVGTTSAEALHSGERMYREGLLASGEPIQAFVKGDLLVQGTAFSCENCHQRSGLGSLEGGVYTLPTNGAKLFRPFQEFFKNIEQVYFPPAPRRPAYTDTSLAEVIRSGSTPSGAVLNEVMPRYLLEDTDMAILIAYLKSLSVEFSQGVTPTTLRFATIITEDVPLPERTAMLAPLDQYINIKNSQSRAYRAKTGARSRQMAENMLVSKELATRNITLARWDLKGPPETWRSQLEEYNRKEPVFALLGGMSTGEWLPIHQFCEDNHIPCLLPLTDFPVISEADWYTLYPSKGYTQEGETAAKYLDVNGDLPLDAKVLQIVRNSREGDALSTGFEKSWQETGRPLPIQFRLGSGEQLNKEVLQDVLKKDRPAAILLWDGPDALQTLKIVADIKERPAIVIVSSRYLEGRLQELPEVAREFTCITWPYAFALKTVRTSMGSTIVPDETVMSIDLSSLAPLNKVARITAQANKITQLVTMALMDMGGSYYRDNLFDVLSMVEDQPSPVFGRISFGPGQRYASKGCYIVRLGKGANPKLIRKSDWVIH